MIDTKPKLSGARRLAPLAALALLAACSDPNAALNERVDKAEAAAKRAEEAALKAEKALSKIEQPKAAPEMVDGGPQLTPEPPQPMVQAAQDQAPEGNAPAQ
ncbi:hypothetical protein [Novosphingobium sp.]|uniref:hypothetical protein n=1 Tax=Novosphingobium sp. TaxID=1874826 RepID=UPI00286D569D|nr:hypothetical protein [Novosphingobium sp.]